MRNTVTRLHRDLLDDEDARNRRAERPPLRRDRSVDWRTRRRLEPGGTVLDDPIALGRFPAWVAGLLAGQPNEWLFIGFARGGRVLYTVANMGNPTAVTAFLPHEHLLNVALWLRTEIVFMLHNHPHCHLSRARDLAINLPSATDLAAARELARELRPRGIALAEFVCVDGAPYEFFWRAACPRPYQLSFADIAAFPSPGRPALHREIDGRFAAKISPWAKAGLWPRI